MPISYVGHPAIPDAADKADEAMKATIYHNPRCSKSRATLALLRENGVEPSIVEYLKTPPDTETIAELLNATGLSPRALMRTNEAKYAELGLDDPYKTEAELIAAMAENPILIERPIVVTDKGTRLCRPPEKVLEIL